MVKFKEWVLTTHCTPSLGKSVIEATKANGPSSIEEIGGLFTHADTTRGPFHVVNRRCGPPCSWGFYHIYQWHWCAPMRPKFYLGFCTEFSVRGAWINLTKRDLRLHHSSVSNVACLCRESIYYWEVVPKAWQPIGWQFKLCQTIMDSNFNGYRMYTFIMLLINGDYKKKKKKINGYYCHYHDLIVINSSSKGKDVSNGLNFSGYPNRFSGLN